MLLSGPLLVGRRVVVIFLPSRYPFEGLPKPKCLQVDHVSIAQDRILTSCIHSPQAFTESSSTFILLDPLTGIDWYRTQLINEQYEARPIYVRYAKLCQVKITICSWNLKLIKWVVGVVWPATWKRTYSIVAEKRGRMCRPGWPWRKCFRRR